MFTKPYKPPSRLLISADLSFLIASQKKMFLEIPHPEMSLAFSRPILLILDKLTDTSAGLCQSTSSWIQTYVQNHVKYAKVRSVGRL